MAKKKTPPARKPNDKAAPADQPKPKSSRALRETVESLVIAFVLAFLFRGFAAEAFVIPTGSMAPTLMGQHKDIFCPQCGFQYQAGASSEAEMALQRGGQQRGPDVVAATCPNCRFTADVDPLSAEGRNYPTFTGDRIIVSKFIYEFANPKRWDVAVFKYPGEAQTNYIKRLIGLPNESLKIHHGDIYIKGPEDDDYHLERRRPVKQRAMAQIVYDNDYLVDAMMLAGWPVRWQPMDSDAAAREGQWTTTDGSRSYAIDGKSADPRWLRYQHFVPSLDQWRMIRNGLLPQNERPRPQLITDYYAYNSSITRGAPLQQAHTLGMHWVGDLLLEFQLQVEQPSGSVLVDLVKGGVHFRCQLDLQSGMAKLTIDGLPQYAPQAETKVRSTGSYHVALGNFDRQLVLWIDGSVVTFDVPTEYDELGNDTPRSTADDPLDLAPAGIASQGAAVRVSNLRLWRDVYYIAAKGRGPLADYSIESPLLRMNYEDLRRFWASPEMWSASIFNSRREATFTLADDQFFVLGDNSPASSDARLWEAEPYVARELLVGQALIIFWPHSFHRLPGTNLPFPFFPNFARMGLIR